MGNEDHLREGQLERYREYLRLLARLHLDPCLRDKVEDSDVVQEVFLRAYQGLASLEYRGEAEFVAWLRRILVNTLTDLVRRYRTEARDVDLERSLADSSACLEAWLAASDSSPSDRVVRHEELGALAQALAQLPEDHRRALEMKYLQGLPLEQIAAQLGRTRPSVAGLLRRALDQLRMVLVE